MIPVKMSKGGRVVVPVEIRRELGMTEGGIVILEVVDGEVRLTTRVARIRRAQALVRRHVPAGASLARELIADRRREAAGPGD
jgi:AbrB family looped-hinge helix DNA binding protein